MKLAYVNLSYNRSPVHEKRLEALAKGAALAGISPFDFFFVNGFREDAAGPVRYVKHSAGTRSLTFCDFLLRRYPVILKSVDLARYDAVILRYPYGDPSAPFFRTPCAVMTEHHTEEIPEYLSHLGMKGNPALMAMKLVRLVLEKKFGPRILGRVNGIIGVTDEIRRYELGRTGVSVPSCVVPNGITVEDVSVTGFRPFDGKRLDIIMLVSSMQPWQGVDRITGAVSRYRGPVEVTLHIVGDMKARDLARISPDLSRIRLHGYQDGKGLDTVMAGMNLAVSSLAMFRNDLQEGCTLKTREYTARGIPFILGYTDPDLEGVEKEFCLKVSNDDSPIEMESIIDFASRISARDRGGSLSGEMRSYALNHMDWSVKAKKYLEFTNQVRKQYNDHHDNM